MRRRKGGPGVFFSFSFFFSPPDPARFAKGVYAVICTYTNEFDLYVLHHVAFSSLWVFQTGRGGRVAAHGGTLSSYIVKNIALDKTDDSNPREAILRHAKEAAENPFWVAPAYKV